MVAIDIFALTFKCFMALEPNAMRYDDDISGCPTGDNVTTPFYAQLLNAIVTPLLIVLRVLFFPSPNIDILFSWLFLHINPYFGRRTPEDDELCGFNGTPFRRMALFKNLSADLPGAFCCVACSMQRGPHNVYTSIRRCQVMVSL